MYIEKLATLLSNLYHAYPAYVIAAAVCIVILIFARPKAMAKTGIVVAALLVVIYIAGLIQQGIANSSSAKKNLTEKSRPVE